MQDEYEYDNEAGVDLGGDAPLDTPAGGTPGRPGVDYPALSNIPKTTFSCKTQRYKGFFGDPDTNCQVTINQSIKKVVNQSTKMETNFMCQL